MVEIWWLPPAENGRTRRKVLHVVWCLFLGQVVSFLLTVGSFTTSFLTDLGVDLPLTQAFFNYLLLALVFGSILLYRRTKLKVPWYAYIILGFVDVQGNYLVLKAYQYSSITSVTLLDCCTIPWVMILTRIYIGTRYTILQFIGAAICVLGLVLVLFSDSGVSDGGGTKPLLGDVLVIAGTVFYAISNVWEEFCVKKKDLIEVIGMLGLFGFVIGGCEILIFEKSELESISWTPKIILLIAAYAMSTFLFYCTVPFLLKTSGATMFNLSLLTSDMWAVLIRIFFYHQEVNWLYYTACAAVAIGLPMYSVVGKDPNPTTQIQVPESIPYHPPSSSNEEEVAPLLIPEAIIKELA